jgi:hypothetical protein
MTQLSSPITAFLVAWLVATAIIVILALIAIRRNKRVEGLAQRLHDQAQAAVTRHTWARGAMGTRDDWLVFQRTMENLAATLQQWQEETAV